MVNPNKIRINSGLLRGRMVRFSEADVRPTKATVRKTLFNWLRPVLAGKSCLDCFAGSGILAFEALSEGASQVLCVDRSTRVIGDIQKNARDFGVHGLSALQASFPCAIKTEQMFDIVFMDPPFTTVSSRDCLYWLRQQACIRPGALVYVEAGEPITAEAMQGFVVVRSAKTAGVCFYLLVHGDPGGMHAAG